MTGKVLEPPGGIGELSVGVMQPATRNAALRMLVHEGDHPAQALLRRIEEHIGVQEQHVGGLRGAEHAIQIGGVMQRLFVPQDQRLRKVPLQVFRRIARGIVDQQQPHPQSVAGGLEGGQQRFDQPRWWV